jgi:hypothetical protein
VTTGDLLDRLAMAIGDRYRLERELGAGGMATVYLAAARPPVGCGSQPPCIFVPRKEQT